MEGSKERNEVDKERWTGRKRKSMEINKKGKKKERNNADVVVVRTAVQKHLSEMSHMQHIQASGRSQCVLACRCSPLDLRLRSLFYMSLTAEQSRQESCVMRPPIKRSVHLFSPDMGFQTISLHHSLDFNELGHLCSRV